jgi:holin-like protein
MAIAGAEHARLGDGYLCWLCRSGSSAIFAQILKLLSALAILTGFQWLGQIMVDQLMIELPAPLLGMLLLLVILTLFPQLLTVLDRAANLLIQNLSLMFIPPSVGAFFLGAEIYQQFPSLLATIVLSTIAAIIVMAVLIRVLPETPGNRSE